MKIDEATNHVVLDIFTEEVKEINDLLHTVLQKQEAEYHNLKRKLGAYMALSNDRATVSGNAVSTFISEYSD